MDVSVKFYCDLLNLKVKSIANEEGEFLDNMLSRKNVKNKVAKLTANNGTALIELIESESFSNVLPRDFFTIGASHVAFTVDDLDKTYEYLLDNKYQFDIFKLKKDKQCKIDQQNLFNLCLLVSLKTLLI